MYRRKGWRALVALAAVALLAAGCGDDDDDGGDASASGSASAPADESAEDEAAQGSSTVEVEMVDFGYVVSGPLATGVQTFRTTNSGDEIHMMGLGKLKEGVTVEDVVAALAESGQEGAPEEDAGAEDGATDEETSRAAQDGGSDADGGEADGTGGEGEEGGDPFEELFEAELGTPGHILLPGVSQSITLEDDLDVGSYALICFIPSEGDGAPHFAKGMVQGLEVVEAGDTGEIPEADAQYGLPDGAVPDGPTEVAGGEVTFEVTNDGEVGKDFIIAHPAEGRTFEDFDEFFVEEFEGEGPPEPGVADRVPGVVAGSTFEIPAGQTIYLTAELDPGSWALVSTNNDESGEGEDFILEITVT